MYIACIYNYIKHTFTYHDTCIYVHKITIINIYILYIYIHRSDIIYYTIHIYYVMCTCILYIYIIYISYSAHVRRIHVVSRGEVPEELLHLWRRLGLQWATSHHVARSDGMGGGCLPNGGFIQTYGYGSIPINTIFRGMNIHLPAILMFTRGTRVLTHCHIETLVHWYF